MPSDRLFAGPDFHSVLEHYKAKLVEAYEQLSDEEAVDEQVQSNLKKQFMLDVPVLRPQGEIWAEEGIAKVDVRRLPNRMPGLGDRPIYEDVPQFTVHVGPEAPRFAISLLPTSCARPWSLQTATVAAIQSRRGLDPDVNNASRTVL